MDGGGAVAAAEDATDGDDGDIDQQVFAVTDVPRVGERFEVRSDGADVNELGHGSHPGFQSVWAVASNGGRQRPGHEERNQDIDPRPVAPDHPDRSAIRAGRGWTIKDLVGQFSLTVGTLKLVLFLTLLVLGYIY